MGSEVLAGGIVWRSGASVSRSVEWQSSSIMAREKKRSPKRFATASGNRAQSCEVLHYGELIALTRRASLFVGGDTGPMHLAAALRVPVVALFGPTRPERNGPYGTRSIVLRNPESVDNTIAHRSSRRGI